MWWKDFIWKDWPIVTVKETGARIRIDKALLSDVWAWVSYFVVELVRLIPRKLFSRREFRVYFTPNPPRPWYLLWPVIHLADGRIVNTLQKADTVFYFQDKTRGEPEPLPELLTESGAASDPESGPIQTRNMQAFNMHCHDISKSKVAQEFYTVFGYELAVNPREFHGPMVVKSEQNGTHDGYIAQGPTLPEPGWVYQHLIKTDEDDGYVTDLRCPTIRGDIPLVYIKRRPVGRRFDNMNSSVSIANAKDLFSREELAQIKAFCTAMKLDWGGIDILRDQISRKIYIVDVNKTDMGPPLTLPLRQKLFSTAKLSSALKASVKADRSSAIFTGESVKTRKTPG